jgi:phenol 2-monooxygenase (NADPH)
MNVSMQDTYNLVWKLGAVINGSANRAILKTYQAERRQVALDLLAADREVSSFYSHGPGKRLNLSEKMGTEGGDFKAMRERMHEFLAGVGVTYCPSLLVAESNEDDQTSANNSVSESGEPQPLKARQDLARNIKLGARLPSFKVINQAEARPLHLADMLKSDGRWRMIVFAGDLLDASQSRRIQRLGAALALPTSVLSTYTPTNAPVDSVIELLTVHSSPRTAVELSDLPDVFHPYDEELGWDYWKVFADDVAHHEGFEDAYGKYGINRREGCIVVCRPDQHVGYIGALEDVDDVERYFAGILIPRA